MGSLMYITNSPLWDGTQDLTNARQVISYQATLYPTDPVFKWIIKEYIQFPELLDSNRE